MKTQVHHIQKQKMDFDFKDKALASDWNKKGSDYYMKEIMPYLADLLDDLFGASKVVRVDRIEIDVGTVTEKELKNAILHNLRKKFQAIQDRGSEKVSKGTIVEQNDESIVSGNQIVELLMDSLIYFLRFGILPWNSPVRSLQELEAEIMEMSGDDVISISEELKTILKTQAVRFRLWQQFSEDFTKEVLLAALPQLRELQAFSENLEQMLKSTVKSVSILKKLQQQLTKSWMAWVSNQSVVFYEESNRQFLNWLIPRLAATLQIPAKAMAGVLWTKIGLIDHSDTNQKLIHILNEYQSEENLHGKESSASIGEPDYGTDPEEQRKHQEPNADSSGADIPEPQEGRGSSAGHNGDEESPELNKGTSKTSAKKTDTVGETVDYLQDHSERQRKAEDQVNTHYPKEPSVSPETPGDPFSVLSDDRESSEQPGVYPGEELDFSTSFTDPPVPEAYYLNHAGLVLTWPYLETLFKRLDLLNERSWKSTWHQEKAVHLVGYAASGKEVNEEPQLLLPKFLCGWPLHQPVHREEELSASALEEVELMLKGLIKNWGILKNTSVEGLRNSFILREGKLQLQQEKEWKLIVAQKSYDLLLDHLPYGISVIKLPWMLKLLKVDWV